MEQDHHRHLVAMIIAEARDVTGGLTLTGEQALTYARRCLAGREDIARPATWLRARMRNHPEEVFAIAAGEDPPAVAADHRPRLHPSSRPVSEVIPNYHERRAQVLAYYDEQARRKEAGEPFLWQDRETRLRAMAAEQAEEQRRRDQMAQPAPAALPTDALPEPGSDEPPF